MERLLLFSCHWTEIPRRLDCIIDLHEIFDVGKYVHWPFFCLDSFVLDCLLIDYNQVGNRVFENSSFLQGVWPFIVIALCSAFLPA